MAVTCGGGWKRRSEMLRGADNILFCKKVVA